ncbi:uncharacterized protein [Triticum aestivum]|uniref:uncharacterized protein n=2 Tax=Triticum aestivum TaxID=4565 RepID=UPI001D0067A5|nr:uncharacterized protein LOC123176823 [Triticum aestivum]
MDGTTATGLRFTTERPMPSDGIGSLMSNTVQRMSSFPRSFASHLRPGYRPTPTSSSDGNGMISLPLLQTIKILCDLANFFMILILMVQICESQALWCRMEGLGIHDQCYLHFMLVSCLCLPSFSFFY